jgi:hypothetical protein
LGVSDVLSRARGFAGFAGVTTLGFRSRSIVPVPRLRSVVVLPGEPEPIVEPLPVVEPEPMVPPEPVVEPEPAPEPIDEPAPVVDPDADPFELVPDDPLLVLPEPAPVCAIATVVNAAAPASAMMLNDVRSLMCVSPS